MPTRLALDLDGDVQLRRELLRFAGGVDDPSPALEEIADRLLDIEAIQFASEGGYASGGWAPLSPAYLSAKVAAGLDSRILRRTGRLHASLTNANDADHVRRITKSELEFGTAVPYAGYHQHGTSRMPQRRPVELREADRREMVKVLQRFMVTGQVG